MPVEAPKSSAVPGCELVLFHSVLGLRPGVRHRVPVADRPGRAATGNDPHRSDAAVGRR
jgi:hypothetical protein